MFVVFVVEGPDYSYLLGLYLGDGCISDTGRTYQLRFFFDARYPGIVAGCAAALERVSPNRVSVLPRRGMACTTVTSSWKLWPLLFPQHGPGKKHTRRIVLAAWQRDLVDRHRELFLRGLVESDGCRTINRFRTTLPSGRTREYEYVRYFFSNLSPDIRGLFCEACEALGVRWTRSNERNISVSHRDSVAILEKLVGPKA